MASHSDRRPQPVRARPSEAGRSVNQSQTEASSIAGRGCIDYAVDDFWTDFTVVPLETQVLANVRTLLSSCPSGALRPDHRATDAAHLLLADFVDR